MKLFNFLTLFILTFFILFSTKTNAQSYEYWPNVGVNYSLNKHNLFTIATEHFISKDDALYSSNLQLFWKRKLPKGWHIRLGFKHEETFESNTTEERSMVELNYSFNIGVVKTTFRNRAEFRYFHNEANKFRHRHRIKFSARFRNFSPFLSSEFNRYGDESHFYRNRSILGVKFPYNKFSVSFFVGNQCNLTTSDKSKVKRFFGTSLLYNI